MDVLKVQADLNSKKIGEKIDWTEYFPFEFSQKTRCTMLAGMGFVCRGKDSFIWTKISTSPVAGRTAPLDISLAVFREKVFSTGRMFFTRETLAVLLHGFVSVKTEHEYMRRAGFYYKKVPSFYVKETYREEGKSTLIDKITLDLGVTDPEKIRKVLLRLGHKKGKEAGAQKVSRLISVTPEFNEMLKLQGNASRFIERTCREKLEARNEQNTTR